MTGEAGATERGGSDAGQARNRRPDQTGDSAACRRRRSRWPPPSDRPQPQTAPPPLGTAPQGHQGPGPLAARASGGKALVYAESREACTSLLREVAAELSGASNGPDPIALLVDPSPEELADWKRDAPKVEIVSAGQARHAGDAIAQAARRAEGGEDVIVLIDSLSRFAEAFKAATRRRSCSTPARKSAAAAR